MQIYDDLSSINFEYFYGWC